MDNIVILGGGLTGLALAYNLSKIYKDKVVVLEEKPYTGGMAATLTENGLLFDLGSHRLHQDMGRDILKHIEEITDNELLRSPRHGKLYFQGRFLSYPPENFSILRDFKSRQLIDFAITYYRNMLTPPALESDSFEDAMIRRVGKDMYDIFYKDYSIKLWGKSPQDMSPASMKKRMVFMKPGALMKNLFSGKSHFFYPKYGIGEIAKGYERGIIDHGGKIIKGANIVDIKTDNKRISKVVFCSPGTQTVSMETSFLISTISIDDLYRYVFKDLQESDLLEWRGLRILCAVIKGVTRYDAETYYFPSKEIIFGRISELTRYSPHMNSLQGKVFLTVEIPSTEGDALEKIEEGDLMQRCAKDISKVGIIDGEISVEKYSSHYMNKAYPVYSLGWQGKYSRIFGRLDTIDNLYTLGSKGLFLHCNIDHCITQGKDMAEYFVSGRSQDKSVWRDKVSKYSRFGARD